MTIRKDFPKGFMVGKNWWKIKFVPDLKDYDTKTEVCLGLCDPDTKTIYVITKLKPKERFKIALHEYFHALEYEYDIKLDHDHIYKMSEAMAELYFQQL